MALAVLIFSEGFGASRAFTQYRVFYVIMEHSEQMDQANWGTSRPDLTGLNKPTFEYFQLTKQVVNWIYVMKYPVPSYTYFLFPWLTCKTGHILFWRHQKPDESALLSNKQKHQQWMNQKFALTLYQSIDRFKKNISNKIYQIILYDINVDDS